jgi:hypothetical protein
MEFALEASAVLALATSLAAFIPIKPPVVFRASGTP